MFGKPWQLFRLLGIPIRLHVSWLLIVGLLTFSLIRLFQENMPDLPPAALATVGLVTTLLLFACIVLHELGHALVARATGQSIRGITLFLFGGVAEMEEEPASALREFVMAIAGPLVSIVLALGFWLLAGLGEVPWIVYPLTYLATVNLALVIFNLVPAFPLDGGRVFRSILWGLLGDLRRATYWASRLGQAFAWVLVGLGILEVFGGHWLQGFWLCLVGSFLHDAAQGSYQQLILRQLLQGIPVERFMTREPVAVPMKLDLRHWVEDYVYRYHRKLFPVVSDGHLAGVIGTQALARYPRAEWERHTVAEVMKPDGEAQRIRPDTDALQALEQMRRAGTSRLLVTEGDRLVGVVSLTDLLGFLDLRLELENDKP